MSKHTKFVTKSQKGCQAKAKFSTITEEIFAIYIFEMFTFDIVVIKITGRGNRDQKSAVI